MLLFGSAVVGGFVDNIPYTAAMVPIVERHGGRLARTPAPGSPLWWAFVLGADLGGNTTAVAAGANVVVLGIAAKAGHPISFWQFTKYGLVVTLRVAGRSPGSTCGSGTSYSPERPSVGNSCRRPTSRAVIRFES